MVVSSAQEAEPEPPGRAGRPCGQAGGDRGESDVLGMGVMWGPAGVSAEGHSWVR